MTPTGTRPLRLTFNKPAVSQFMPQRDDEQTKGLRVRIQDGVLQFMPVTEEAELEDTDVVRLIGDNPKTFVRKRGGSEVRIEGALTEEANKALKNRHSPFFQLTRTKDGWLTTSPLAEAPGRFDAHVRVWNDEHGRIGGDSVGAAAKGKVENKTQAKAAPRPAPVRMDASVYDISDALSRVRDARNFITQFSETRRPGRPPRELDLARKAISSFTDLANELGIGATDDGEKTYLRQQVSEARREVEKSRAEFEQTLKTFSERFQTSLREIGEVMNRVGEVRPQPKADPVVEVAPPKAKVSKTKVAKAPKARKAKAPKASKTVNKTPKVIAKAPAPKAAEAPKPALQLVSPEPAATAQRRGRKTETRAQVRRAARHQQRRAS